MISSPGSPRWSPSADEVVLGAVFGPWPDPPPLPDPSGRTTRAALESVVLAGLRRPPCAVSFSGGRDSSLVLAVAAHVARREGLPMPVALTHRFPDVPESDESAWQEMVVEAAGVEDWQRMTWHGEMDVLGPHARTVLERVGVLDPFNAFFHEPLLAAVSGGSLLTGVGGDELLSGPMEGPAFRIRYRHRRPRLDQLAPLAASFAPRRLKARRVVAADPFGHQVWLRPSARADLTRRYAAWRAAEPVAWDGAVRRFWGSRECHLGLAGLDAIAAAHDVVVLHPLSSAPFVGAMTATHGHGGPGGRGPATAELAGDVLPAALVRRRGKAAFTGAFWTGAAGAFAAGWSGGGVDTDRVDVDALRAEWLRPGGGHVSSVLLLHQAWLHDSRAGGPWS